MSKFSLTRTEPPVSEETALGEVQKLLQFYGYDIDALADGPVKTNAESALELLTRAVREGFLEFTESPKFVITQKLRKIPTGGAISVIEYAEFTGATKVNLDRVPSGETYRRMYSLLGSLSGLPFESFKVLGGEDLALAEAIGFFFLSR